MVYDTGATNAVCVCPCFSIRTERGRFATPARTSPIIKWAYDGRLSSSDAPSPERKCTERTAGGACVHACGKRGRAQHGGAANTPAIERRHVNFYMLSEREICRLCAKAACSGEAERAAAQHTRSTARAPTTQRCFSFSLCAQKRRNERKQRGASSQFVHYCRSPSCARATPRLGTGPLPHLATSCWTCCGHGSTGASCSELAAVNDCKQSALV